MNPTRKTKIEDLEAALQFRIRQTNLVPEERFREKLANLQKFVNELAKTDEGKADLQQRIESFGDCTPLPEESDRHFYGKLRHWLDADVEETAIAQG